MLHNTARDLISSANRILLLTHVSPDGDAIGSLLGLHWALQAAGKESLPVSPDGCPETFRFLPGSDQIRKDPDGIYDLIIAVDCADLVRTGVPDEKLGRAPDINIDHHTTNSGFARLNLVDETTAATSEFIVELLPAFGLPLTRAAAECLLCGVVSDTLGFRTTNTTAQTLAVTQMLMAAGADLPRIYDLALNRRSFNAVLLWGYALSHTEIDEGLVWAAIPLAAKQAIGYTGKGDTDVINVLGTINDGLVFIVFTETENGEVKISWRARSGYDVSKIAQLFGGGGHVSAAGATVKGTMAEVEEKVLNATRKIMTNGK